MTISTSNPAQLSARGIQKRYGSFTALDDIYLDVQPGEFLTLLGPSGSGKTTLLMILAGFLEASEGQLLQHGHDITHLAAEKRNFGMVFQGYALFPHLSVADNVAFPLKIRRVPAAERQQRVKRILEVVGLAEHAHKRPTALSGGQQQRVAIARALVFEPELLLLDEPLSALDKNLREQLQAELKRIHQEIGTSFVFVTHDQGEALALSSRIAIFNRGRLVQVDTPEAIYQRPESRFVAEFIGKMNLFPLHDVHHNGEQFSGRFGSERLHASSSRFFGDKPLLIAVRPEQMSLSREAAVAPGLNSVPVTLAGTSYQGNLHLLSLTLSDGREAQVALHDSDPLRHQPPGTLLYLSWPIAQGRLLEA